jgi:hypothetical protein
MFGFFFFSGPGKLCIHVFVGAYNQTIAFSFGSSAQISVKYSSLSQSRSMFTLAERTEAPKPFMESAYTPKQARAVPLGVGSSLAYSHLADGSKAPTSHGYQGLDAASRMAAYSHLPPSDHPPLVPSYHVLDRSGQNTSQDIDPAYFVPYDAVPGPAYDVASSAESGSPHIYTGTAAAGGDLVHYDIAEGTAVPAVSTSSSLDAGYFRPYDFSSPVRTVYTAPNALTQPAPIPRYRPLLKADPAYQSRRVADESNYEKPEDSASEAHSYERPLDSTSEPYAAGPASGSQSGMYTRPRLTMDKGPTVAHTAI